MVIEKQLSCRLYFNLNNRCFYVQLGSDMLFMVKDTVVCAIQEKEGIDIQHVQDTKEMQIMAGKKEGE